MEDLHNNNLIAFKKEFSMAFCSNKFLSCVCVLSLFFFVFSGCHPAKPNEEKNSFFNKIEDQPFYPKERITVVPFETIETDKSDRAWAQVARRYLLCELALSPQLYPVFPEKIDDIYIKWAKGLQLNELTLMEDDITSHFRKLRDDELAAKQEDLEESAEDSESERDRVRGQRNRPFADKIARDLSSLCAGWTVLGQFRVENDSFLVSMKLVRVYNQRNYAKHKEFTTKGLLSQLPEKMDEIGREIIAELGVQGAVPGPAPSINLKALRSWTLGYRARTSRKFELFRDALRQDKKFLWAERALLMAKIKKYPYDKSLDKEINNFIKKAGGTGTAFGLSATLSLVKLWQRWGESYTTLARFKLKNIYADKSLVKKFPSLAGLLYLELARLEKGLLDKRFGPLDNRRYNPKVYSSYAEKNIDPIYKKSVELLRKTGEPQYRRASEEWGKWKIKRSAPNSIFPATRIVFVPAFIEVGKGSERLWQSSLSKTFKSIKTKEKKKESKPKNGAEEIFEIGGETEAEEDLEDKVEKVEDEVEEIEEEVEVELPFRKFTKEIDTESLSKVCRINLAAFLLARERGGASFGPTYFTSKTFFKDTKENSKVIEKYLANKAAHRFNADYVIGPAIINEAGEVRMSVLNVRKNKTIQLEMGECSTEGVIQAIMSVLPEVKTFVAPEMDLIPVPEAWRAVEAEIHDHVDLSLKYLAHGVGRESGYTVGFFEGIDLALRAGREQSFSEFLARLNRDSYVKRIPLLRGQMEYWNGLSAYKEHLNKRVLVDLENAAVSFEQAKDYVGVAESRVLQGAAANENNNVTAGVRLEAAYKAALKSGETSQLSGATLELAKFYAKSFYYKTRDGKKKKKSSFIKAEECMMRLIKLYNENSLYRFEGFLWYRMGKMYYDEQDYANTQRCWTIALARLCYTRSHEAMLLADKLRELEKEEDLDIIDIPLNPKAPLPEIDSEQGRRSKLPPDEMLDIGG